MSFSAVNMCRFVIAVIFSVSFVSCVLANAEAPADNKNATCQSRPVVKDSRAKLMICFNNIVNRHLHPSNVSTTDDGECNSATDFTEKLNSYISTVKTECNATNLKVNTTALTKLVDFSLRDESFKKFYEDISCVKKLEANISNTCVKGKVGFFNITRERKHTSWIRKINLKFNGHTCGTSKDVKNCVEVFLNSCKPDSREYVASLFKFARDLGDCTQIESKAASIPSPSGNSAAPPAVLTTAVIITISIGAVVIAVAIITIIVLKYKKK